MVKFLYLYSIKLARPTMAALVLTCLLFGSGCASKSASRRPAILEDPSAIATLTNGAVVAKINTKLGRLVHFSRVNQENILWLNDAESIRDQRKEPVDLNWGGDHIWPCQQAIWPFLMKGLRVAPQPDYERNPWRVLRVSPLEICLESPLNPYLGVVVRRTFVLPHDGAGISIENEMTRVVESPYPVHLWSLSLLKLPAYALLDTPGSPSAKERYITLSLPHKPVKDHTVRDVDGAVVFETGPASEQVKIASMGSWLAAVYKQDVLVQKIEVCAQGCYPDGSSAQIFVAKKYIELETLSQNVHLNPGETLKHRIMWRLEERLGNDPAKIASLARKD